MSYYAQVAQQYVGLRDEEVARMGARIQQQTDILAELQEELADASEPDNADAIREELAKWRARRDAQQQKYDEIVAEIRGLENGIASDAKFARVQGERDALRTPYMAIYNQYQEEWIKASPDETLLTRWKAQLDAQFPALDAKQRELDGLTNTKNRNNGLLIGKRRYRDGEEIVLNSYRRQVEKLTDRLKQPSARKPSIETWIKDANNRKAHLESEKAKVLTKYAAIQARIAVGRLYAENGRRPASDAVNGAILADAKNNGATLDMIDEAYEASEDLIDRPISHFLVNGWPASTTQRFSQRKATRRARRLLQQTGAMLAGAPHWTTAEIINHLMAGGHFEEYVSDAGITEEIMRREARLLKTRVDDIIEDAMEEQIDASG